MKVLQPLIDRGDIKIVGDMWVPDWKATEAYLLVAKALEHLDTPLTAIVASNDSVAGGAIQALEDKQMSGKVLVTGQDADLAADLRRHSAHDRLKAAQQRSAQSGRSRRQAGPA